MNCVELYLFFKSNRLDKKCAPFIVFCLFVCVCLLIPLFHSSVFFNYGYTFYLYALLDNSSFSMASN